MHPDFEAKLITAHKSKSKLPRCPLPPALPSSKPTCDGVFMASTRATDGLETDLKCNVCGSFTSYKNAQ